MDARLARLGLPLPEPAPEGEERHQDKQSREASNAIVEWLAGAFDADPELKDRLERRQLVIEFFDENANAAQRPYGSYRIRL